MTFFCVEKAKSRAKSRAKSSTKSKAKYWSKSVTKNGMFDTLFQGGDSQIVVLCISSRHLVHHHVNLTDTKG